MTKSVRSDDEINRLTPSRQQKTRNGSSTRKRLSINYNRKKSIKHQKQPSESYHSLLKASLPKENNNDNNMNKRKKQRSCSDDDSSYDEVEDDQKKNDIKITALSETRLVFSNTRRIFLLGKKKNHREEDRCRLQSITLLDKKNNHQIKKSKISKTSLLKENNNDNNKKKRKKDKSRIKKRKYKSNGDDKSSYKFRTIDYDLDYFIQNRTNITQEIEKIQQELSDEDISYEFMIIQNDLKYFKQKCNNICSSGRNINRKELKRLDEARESYIERIEKLEGKLQQKQTTTKKEISFSRVITKVSCDSNYTKVEKHWYQRSEFHQFNEDQELENEIEQEKKNKRRKKNKEYNN